MGTFICAFFINNEAAVLSMTAVRVQLSSTLSQLHTDTSSTEQNINMLSTSLEHQIRSGALGYLEEVGIGRVQPEPFLE